MKPYHVEIYDKVNITWKNLYHVLYHPRPISALGPVALWLILMSRDDIVCDTDFAMLYSLYINFRVNIYFKMTDQDNYSLTEWKWLSSTLTDIIPSFSYKMLFFCNFCLINRIFCCPTTKRNNYYCFSLWLWHFHRHLLQICDKYRKMWRKFAVYQGCAFSFYWSLKRLIENI